jgi:hypothetical protein
LSRFRLPTNEVNCYRAIAASPKNSHSKEIFANTNELINLFETTFSVESDESFATLLDLDAKQVSFWRAGQWPMPLAVKLRLSDHLGFDWVHESVKYLLNPLEHARLMLLDNQRLAQHLPTTFRAG